MAKHWKDYLQEDKQSKVNEEPKVTWKEILDKNDSLRDLVEEKESLEKELKSYTKPSENRQSNKNYNNEIHSVYQKQKSERIWTKRREGLRTKRIDLVRSKLDSTKKKLKKAKKGISSVKRLKNAFDEIRKPVRRIEKLDAAIQTISKKKDGLGLLEIQHQFDSVQRLDTEIQAVSKKIDSLGGLGLDDIKKPVQKIKEQLNKYQEPLEIAKKIYDGFQHEAKKVLEIEPQVKEYVSKKFTAVKEDKKFKAIEKLKMEKLFKKSASGDKKLNLNNVIRAAKKVDEWQKNRDKQKGKKKKNDLFKMSI